MGDRHSALDGLRAISVLAVILAGFEFTFPSGWIGVLVFFVLSGFLITRILLDERAAADGAGGFFGRFYFRRTLRIFPLYFAYLLVLEVIHLAVGIPQAWDSVRPFAFTYLVNLGMVLGHVDTAPAYGHLWTLAVEEQFYLAWPLFVWALPRRWLGPFALSLVLSGPLVRHACVAWLDWSLDQLYVATSTHADALATGALLALHPIERLPHPRRWALAACATTLVVGVLNGAAAGISVRFLGYPEGLGLGFGTGVDHGLTHVWGYTLLNLTAALVIVAVLRGGLPGLGHPVLAYLGRISYGIYVFQRPLIGVYEAQAKPWLEPHVGSELMLKCLGLTLCVATAVLAAALSYGLLEAPLLRFRNRRVPGRAPITATG